jgi:hypothetical protein
VGELVVVVNRSPLLDADWLLECVGWNFADGDIQAHANDCQLLPLRGNPDSATETRDEVSA